MLVLGTQENLNLQGVDITTANALRVSDLAENGARLTAFSERAITELEEKYFPIEKKKEIKEEETVKESKKKHSEEKKV